jgi:hypothetical protein
MAHRLRLGGGSETEGRCGLTLRRAGRRWVNERAVGRFGDCRRGYGRSRGQYGCPRAGRQRTWTYDGQEAVQAISGRRLGNRLGYNIFSFAMAVT